MDVLTAAILGLVQALTEFLPVSSSGHLVLAQHLLGVESETGLSADAVAVAVHFGTLLSVVLVFRDDVRALVKTSVTAGLQPRSWRTRWAQDPTFRLASAIIIGCIPAGIIGLAFKDQIEGAFESVTVVSVALLVTGVVLLCLLRAPTGDKRVSLTSGLFIGIVQAIAIIPGISRSGSTIAAALFMGLEREHAAKYSFLLSLPVIAGATGIKTIELLDQSLSQDMWLALGTSAFVAFTAGIFALKFLMSTVKSGSFAYFGWYCLLVGILGLVL